MLKQPIRRPSVPRDLPRRGRAALDLHRLSDVVLVARARDGDRGAVDALLARHEGRVRRLAAAILAEREEAQDAAQEALARLVDRIASYRGEAAFTTWLHRLTVNVCTDHARRLARRRRSELTGHDGPLLETPDDGGTPAELAARALPAALRRSFAGLTDRQRTVLVLKDVLSWSYEEIAERLELPVGTVKCHAHRGRRALAERLGRAG